MPGAPLDGSTLVQEAAQLSERDASRAWEEVTLAASQLRRLGWIEWRYVLYPGETSEPRPELIDQSRLQQVRDIVATRDGIEAVGARKRIATVNTQINIINSTVGQLALRDISNVDIHVVLDAIEQSVTDVNAPVECKDEALSAIKRMRTAATEIATTTARDVLAAAVRHSLGLP